MTDETTRPMRVLVAVPTGDMIYSLTALHLISLVVYSRDIGIDVQPTMPIGSVLVNNESNAAHQSLGQGLGAWNADAVLYVEWDHIFPPASLHGLLAHGEDKDIIGATFQQRRPGGETHGFELDGQRIDVSRGGTPREVATLPTGFLLVRRRVFEAMDAAGDLPFFRMPFTPGAQGSGTQDYDFCRRARALGFKVWLDPELSLAIGHIGNTVFQLQRATSAASSVAGSSAA